MYRRQLVGLLGMVLLVAFQYGHAGARQTTLLPPEKAFQSNAQGVREGIRVTWSIADGYYLYATKFRFQTNTPTAVLGTPELPKGELKQDPFFGELEIFRGEVSVIVPVSLKGSPGQLVELQATSQGCADQGICYPPQTRDFRVALTDEAGAKSQTMPTNDPVAALAALASILGGGNAEDEFLDPENAFALDSELLDEERLRVSWTIAEGYYLYRDKLQFKIVEGQGVVLGNIELPSGEFKHDEFFGTVEVFHQQVEAIIAIERANPDPAILALEVGYQGCAEAGLCYPPLTKRITFSLPAMASAAAAPQPPAAPTQPSTADASVVARDTPPSDPTGGEGKLSEQDRIARSLALDNRWLVLVTFFAFGLLLAFTPCVFPMVPILSGIIAGQGDRITTGRAFVLSSVYVLAMAATYTLAGVVAGLFGHNLQATFQNPWLLGAFSGIFVLLALSMFGFFELQLPSRWQSGLARLSGRQQGGTLLGVAVMGVLSALIVGPCVAPPLAGALIYIGQSADAVLGATALFALSLGMGAPLLVIGTSAGKLLPRAGPWMATVKHIFGVLLLAVAIYLLERLLPGWLAMLLWASLLIVTAVYMGALEPLQPGVSGWQRLWKGTGLIALVYGVVLVVGAASGAHDVLRPLHKLAVAGSGASASEPLAFKRIKGLAELEAELKAASAIAKPVVLDYYADWCVSCKEMEEYTFADPGVSAALAETVLLQTDVTQNDAQDRALLQRFGLFGPPAILFFGPDGTELRGYRVVGFMNAEEFQAHVREALR